MLTISVQIGVAKMNAAQPIGPIRSTTPIRMLTQPSHFGRAAWRSARTALAKKSTGRAYSAPMKNASPR
jgi:hypothetical protein